ncbi:hypothetical protein [Blastococcus mobilis]|nr:hypothetical protein [Blastococcus mobilis]
MRFDRVLVRDATAEDVPALTDALFQAINWQGAVRGGGRASARRCSTR